MIIEFIDIFNPTLIAWPVIINQGLTLKEVILFLLASIVQVCVCVCLSVCLSVCVCLCVCISQACQVSCIVHETPTLTFLFHK